MIRHLIRLDFYAMKPLTKVILPFLLVPIILGTVADVGMSILVTLTFVVYLLNIVFSITEKSDFNKLYGILPIKKSSNVLSRYLFSLIILGITAVISFMIYIMLSLLTKGNVDWMYGIQFLSLSMLLAIAFISIQYPFYFKFAYAKASIMAVLPYIICFAIGIPFMNYMMKNQGFSKIVMAILTYFQSNLCMLLCISLGLSCMCIVVSYMVARKIQKREF